MAQLRCPGGWLFNWGTPRERAQLLVGKVKPFRPESVLKAPRRLREGQWPRWARPRTGPHTWPVPSRTKLGLSVKCCSTIRSSRRENEGGRGRESDSESESKLLELSQIPVHLRPALTQVKREGTLPSLSPRRRDMDARHLEASGCCSDVARRFRTPPPSSRALWTAVPKPRGWLSL